MVFEVWWAGSALERPPSPAVPRPVPDLAEDQYADSEEQNGREDPDGQDHSRREPPRRSRTATTPRTKTVITAHAFSSTMMRGAPSMVYPF